MTATLSYSVPSTSPLKLTIGFDISANLRLTTLDGGLKLDIEQLEANICYKRSGVSVVLPLLQLRHRL